MRLHQVLIKNYRKLKNCKIELRDTSFLIGPNNTGKSSVFAALDHLHKNSSVSREDHSKTYHEEDDCYHYEPEIEIIAEYHNLPAESETWVGFRGRVISHTDVIEGETNKKILYKKVWELDQSKPKIFMFEYPRKVSEQYKACENISDLVGVHFSEAFLKEHFGESNFSKKISAVAVKPKLTDLPEYWDIDGDQEPEWIENPGGIPGNVLSKLPRIVVIPAESCASELTSKNGALFSLLEDLFTLVRQDSENYEQAQRFLNELASELDPSDKGTHFGKLIEDLNAMTHSLFPESSVHISASLGQPDKVIKPQFNVEMESNVKTAVDYQGHGMIRATAFQLLRYVQEFVNREAEIPRATIFCFEEPEIYLHPSAANQMRDALYELAGRNCQIIATTHSPFMVNLGSEKSVSLTKFSHRDDGFADSASLNLDLAFDQLEADEKQYLKMLLKVDDYISRMFFARKSIFVEGDTEEVVVRETIKRLSVEDKARVIGNCEFLRARGKPVLISIAKYLNTLGIDYMILHDRDQGTRGADAINNSILAQTGPDRRVMAEENIEDVLGYEPPSSDKPYAAYMYIQNSWGDTFDTVPENWRSIFLDLCEPYLKHLRNK